MCIRFTLRALWRYPHTARAQSRPYSRQMIGTKSLSML